MTETKIDPSAPIYNVGSFIRTEQDFANMIDQTPVQINTSALKDTTQINKLEDQIMKTPFSAKLVKKEAESLKISPRLEEEI